MRVYLMRHGEAADRAGYERDGDRPLTAAGRAHVRAAAARWVAEGEPPPASWLVSPYVRAVQTCEICASAFASEAPIEVTRDLVPDARVSVAAEWVEQQRPGPVAIVGHQPLLGGLAAFLLGWGTVPAQVQTGAVLAIDLPDEGAGTLAWHLRPSGPGEAPVLLRPSPGGA